MSKIPKKFGKKSKTFSEKIVKILSQQAVEVVVGDREKTEQRIHAVEHELYTKTLQQLFSQ